MTKIIKENLYFLKQSINLSKSNLIKSYKGAALGPLWAVFKPAFLIFIYWFAFKYGMRSAADMSGHSFVIWLIVGNLPWAFMSDAIRDGSGAIRNNKQFVTKMPFPMSTIMTFVNLSNIYVHILLMLIVIVILFFSGYGITIYWLQLLFYMPLMLFYFIALSWITAPLSAISKDFYNFVKSMMTALFWVSGILWDPYSMKKGAIQAIMLMNPITYFVNGYRNIFLYKKWFFDTPFETVSFFVILVITMVVGSIIFNKLRKNIPDVL